MVGRAVTHLGQAGGHTIVACTRQELDISNETEVFALLERERPDSIINCAAYTDVDGSEVHRDLSRAANALGPEVLARGARHIGASLVTISTDYVFDGTKGDFYTLRDDPNPLGIYAKDKLEGERRAQAASARTTIVRTGWIFGHGGKNFLSRVVDYARAGNPMKAIDDAFGTPTYAPDLAGRLIELASRDLPGIYHVTNAGNGASFAGFAREALQLAGLSPALIENVSFASLKRQAARPRDSRLRCLLSEAIGLKSLRHWEKALQEFIGDAKSS